MHSLSEFPSQIEPYIRILANHLSLPLTKSSQKIFGDQNLSIVHLLHQASLLAVKQHQNWVIDLDPVKYDIFMLPMIECLKYSPLTIAISRMQNVPLSIMSKAYLSANYVEEEQSITFEIHNNKTSITKSQLCSLLQLPQSDDIIKLEMATSAALLEIFYQMDYKENLTAVSKFKNPYLPPHWNWLFTLLLKGFLKRVTGSDYVSKLFMAIFYGLYIGLNIDYGTIL